MLWPAPTRIELKHEDMKELQLLKLRQRSEAKAAAAAAAASAAAAGRAVGGGAAAAAAAAAGQTPNNAPRAVSVAARLGLQPPASAI
jgi:hypothetical protein